MVNKISHSFNVWTATLLIQDNKDEKLEVSLSNEVQSKSSNNMCHRVLSLNYWGSFPMWRPHGIFFKFNDYCCMW